MSDELEPEVEDEVEEPESQVLAGTVAVVGFPNAGKSTLISRLSAARPKVADYPFTTLEPHLGVVRAPGTRRRAGEGGPTRPAEEFVVADIPGLIEGASEGRGLGHRFLRHVERARVLLVLADLASLERSPAEQVAVLLEELGAYRPELLDRPRLVVGSRADVLPPGERPPLSGYDGELEISSASGEGLEELVRRLGDLVASEREAAPARTTAPVLHRPGPEGVEVVRQGAGFVVLGRDAERAVALSDLTDPAALEQVQRRLRRLGVGRALQRAGARAGDAVRVGGLEFSYEPDQ